MMLRASSTRSRLGYERLGDESGIGLLGDELKRTTSVPVRLSCHSRKQKPQPELILEEPPHQTKSTAKKESKLSHPIFSFFMTRKRKKKSTAKPEVARYLQYLKEGGMWDVGSNMPVIYYK